MVVGKASQHFWSNLQALDLLLPHTGARMTFSFLEMQVDIFSRRKCHIPLAGQVIRASTWEARGGQGDEWDADQKVAPPGNETTCKLILISENLCNYWCFECSTRDPGHLERKLIRILLIFIVFQMIQPSTIPPENKFWFWLSWYEQIGIGKVEPDHLERNCNLET